jgi:hypothetical protein
VLAAGHPRAVAGRVRATALGLAVSLAVALAICGYALWVQLAGPQREHSVLVSSWATNPAFFVDPAGTIIIHTSAGAAAASGFHLGVPEVLAYLGWPLIVVLVAAAIRFWREPRVRAAAVTFVVLALCSLGGAAQRHFPTWLLPWHWLQGLPGLAQLLPNRFSILADGAAAAVGAFSLDLARSATPRAWAWRAVPVTVAVLAVLPLIPLPYQAATVTPVPAGWRIVRPPPARSRRPCARGPDPERGSHLCHALAGGHQRARLTDRRLLPRAQPYRAGHLRPRPGQGDRQVRGFPLGRHGPRDRLVRRADPSGPRVLAARRRDRGRPAPRARPRPDRAVRQTHPPRRRGAGVAALAAARVEQLG